MADPANDELRVQGNEFLKRSALKMKLASDGSRVPLILLNGQTLTVKKSKDIGRVILAQSEKLLHTIQRAVYYGQLPDDGNVAEFFMNLPTVAKRLNPRASQTDGAVVDMSGTRKPLGRT